MKTRPAWWKPRQPHKYAINAALLGDMSNCPWTNLGYWDVPDISYPKACEKMAKRLADAVQLQPTDRLIDLGCGQGASLLLWTEHYQLTDVSAVEMQPACVAHNQKFLPHLSSIYCGSFLQLQQLPLNSPFDAAVCVDAAYHSPISQLLNSVHPVLTSGGRLAFHALVLTDRFAQLSRLQRLQLRLLLKAADISLDELYIGSQLPDVFQKHGFELKQMQVISKEVFHGFANYIQCLDTRFWKKITQYPLDQVKIRMTAKLCSKLYQDGYVDYVELIAIKH